MSAAILSRIRLRLVIARSLILGRSPPNSLSIYHDDQDCEEWSARGPQCQRGCTLHHRHPLLGVALKLASLSFLEGRGSRYGQTNCGAGIGYPPRPRRRYDPTGAELKEAPPRELLQWLSLS